MGVSFTGAQERKALQVDIAARANDGMAPTLWHFGGRTGSSLWLQLDLKSRDWGNMRW